MIDPPPPPAHVRIADAERKLEQALSDPKCRKKLKDAATKIAADTRRVEKERRS